MSKYPSPELLSHLPPKVKKSQFYRIFARKIPEFYIIIGRKIFFPNFTGARAPSATPHARHLPSPTHMHYAITPAYAHFTHLVNLIGCQLVVYTDAEKYNRSFGTPPTSSHYAELTVNFHNRQDQIIPSPKMLIFVECRAQPITAIET